MIKFKDPFYLASKSPRRKLLLNQIGIEPKIISTSTIEEIIDGEKPIKTVKRLSLEKLNSAKKQLSSGIVLTADTIVVLNNEIIGKPTSKKDAELILSKLSGNKHFVYTGFAIYNFSNNKLIVDYEKTTVYFIELSNKLIKDYIKTGSPMDKAGAYGIQEEFGSVFVKNVNGCYYNVMGLPLSKVYQSILSIK